MVFSFLALALAAASPDPFDPGPNPLLMQHPTTNGRQIVFRFADDLWSVPFEGGSAVRITSGRGVEQLPFFSPDGKQIAFSAQYDGNTDVFVMPAEGGVPKRLTAHPGSDMVTGWTPDGKRVTFSSGMSSIVLYPRLFSVPAEGGLPVPYPLPGVTAASLSPDGTQVAYVPTFKWQKAWKRYRGGQAYSIWIAQLSDSKWKAIPKKRENIEEPMWVGNTVYYLSDHRGPVGINAYDVTSGKVSEVVKGEGFDVKSATAGTGVIVYEKLGSLHVLDLATRQSRRVPVEIKADLPDVRTEIKSLAAYYVGDSLSPSGHRVAVAARGRIFTVPASKGDARLIADGDGIDRYDPAWSPNGKYIAFITDERNRQELAMIDLSTGEQKLYALGSPPAYYYGPQWSPDSKKLAYTDNRHQVWYLDLETGTNTSIDAGVYTDPMITIRPRWSPDSNWLTWSRDLDSHMNAVFLYSLESGKVTQITDGLANAKSPVFDRDGKHLYFFASTTTGQAISWLDISSMNQPNDVSSVYAVVLSKDGPNPLQPESDEEAIKEDPKPAPAEAPKPEAAPQDAPKPSTPPKPSTRIDLDSIEHRIIALPMPAQGYTRLDAGPAGSVFAFVGEPRVLATEFTPLGSVVKFSFADRKTTPFVQGVTGFSVSPNGDKLLLGGMGGISIVSAMAPPAPGQGQVSLEGLRAKVNPRAEWSRMYEMIWPNERMLFYDEHLHGANADQLQARYRPFVRNIASRSDLNYLFTDMLGELSIGHMWANGGEFPGVKAVPGGLLGADYTFENGRYRLARIFNGERWNPDLRAPLAQPGINAKTGEYVLAIDGRELTDAMDIYEALEGKAGRQVKVKLGPNANGMGAREVVVVPVGSEAQLRKRAWVEDNRRRVDEATNGQVGYVHVPDTGEGGWTEFNRYYYSQLGKKGLIVDERFNGGGFINNFMVDEISRGLDGVFTPRHGKDWPTPGTALLGPKVMLVNEAAGSGGDMFPWLFKHRKIGPVVGKRTWGGLVASFGFPLPDGGRINSPDVAFYNPWTGTWDVEGYGVEPDIEVEFDPYVWRQGKDAQLERAIEEVKRLMATYKYPTIKRPKPADKTKPDVRH